MTTTSKKLADPRVAETEKANAAAEAVLVAASAEAVAPTAQEPLRLLTRAEILESEDLATEPVRVPEWHGQVTVRAMTGSERDAYESEMFSSKGGTVEYNLQNVRAKLCARTIVDAKGSRMFSDSDIVLLGLKSAAALERVFKVAQRLSRLTQEDVKELTTQMGNGRSADSGSV
jgi:hypothetical protein